MFVNGSGWAFNQVSVHLAKWKRRFLEIDQPETIIFYGVFANILEQYEQSL